MQKFLQTLFFKHIFPFVSIFCHLLSLPIDILYCFVKIYYYTCKTYNKLINIVTIQISVRFV